jgi:ATP-dependent DNA helicase 2 subunit 2
MTGMVSVAKLAGLANKKAISAIIVAIQMIVEHCKKLLYRRRIVLVTDARGEMDGEDNPEIAKRMEQEGVELTVVYVCCSI